LLPYCIHVRYDVATMMKKATELTKRTTIVLAAVLTLSVAAFGISKDLVYLRFGFLIVLVEILRFLIGIIAILVLRAYFLDLEDSFQRRLKIGFTLVAAFNASICLTRPAIDHGEFLLCLLFLVACVFTPLRDRKYKRWVVACYSISLIGEALFPRRLDFLEFAAVFLTVAGIDVFGWILEANRPSPILPAILAKALRREKKVEVLDYSSQIDARVRCMPLSDREKEVAVHLLMGENRAEIATKLFISDETIKKHVANIYVKLRVSSRSELFKKILSK